MKVSLKDVRLSFPNLFTAKSVLDSDPKFSASFLIEPGSESATIVEAAIESVAKEKWGAKADAFLKQLRASNKICLHDGDTKEYEGYAGMLYLSANSTARPLIIDRDKSNLDSADGKPYAGCYVNAQIDIYAQDNQYGKRINATLRGVQFMRDGDAFTAGGVASEDEFDDLSDIGDASDLV